MKRLLMTADAVGGVFSYALDLAGDLCARGVEVVLAVMGPPANDAQRARARAIDGLRWAEASYKLEWQDDPWSDVAEAGRWLRALARRERVDLVHLNGYAHAALDFGVPKLVVAHSCVLSWWQAVKGEPAPERYATYRARVSAGLHAADAVVAPTQAMADALRVHYGPLPEVEVIHNGCDLHAFTPGRKTRSIVSAGRGDDEAKNLDALLRVAPALPWSLAIAGACGRPECLGTLSAEAMQELLAQASIFASPARYEPFGLAILEAAASGCALVLGDIPSLRELWDGAAAFVPPDDDEALAATLQRLCRDHAARLALGERARALAVRRSQHVTSEAYRSLYRSLLTGASACASSASITR